MEDFDSLKFKSIEQNLLYQTENTFNSPNLENLSSN